MLVWIALVVVLVIVLIGVGAFILTRDDGASPTLAMAVPVPEPAPIGTTMSPASVVPTLPSPVVVQPSPAPVPPSSGTMSPASEPTPSPTVTPAPIPQPVVAGLPSGIKRGHIVRKTTGAIYKISNDGKKRHFPNMQVYRSWGSPPFKDYAPKILNQIPDGPPMELKTTSSATVTTPAAVTPTTTHANKYRTIARSDITPGVDQWAHNGTLESCAKKCATTPGCVGFTRVDNGCWGKTSANVVPGGATVYLDKNATVAATPTTPTLYKDQNLTGTSWKVPSVGQHVVGGGIKNAVSSIRVPNGWRLSVYDKDDCTGTSKVYTGNVNSLKGTGLNNDIACVRLRRT